MESTNIDWTFEIEEEDYSKKMIILPRFRKQIEKIMIYEIYHYPNSTLETFCLEKKIKNKSSLYMNELNEMWNELKTKEIYNDENEILHLINKKYE